MKEQQEKAILEFLEEWPTEESLSSPFVNSIKNGRYVDGAICYLPDNDKENSAFWCNYIISSTHFYVFAILNKWMKETSSNIIIQRIDAYSKQYMEDIVNEMDILLYSIEKNTIQKDIREYIDCSINAFLNRFISNISLLSVFCKKDEFKNINKIYRVILLKYLGEMESKSMLSLFIAFIISNQHTSINTVSGRKYINVFVQMLSERYEFAQFSSLLLKTELECNSTEWEAFITQLKKKCENCLKYCDASNICVDGIILGFTSYTEADEIKKKNKIEGKSDSGSTWSYGKIEYNGTDISFNPNLGGLCCGMHLYNGWDEDNCKNALNHFLRIVFKDPNLDSKEMSYNDFVALLKKNDFFELQKFHYPPKYWHYSAQWRQVNSSHICDFIFSIDAPKDSADAELAKQKKDISIQLDIYLNDYDDQDELYKTIPPDTSTDSYDSYSSSDSYEFDMGFMGLVGG
jgi:hypothetical protein